jgi:glycosyltransferase involved in cell wall biosynthesis
MKVLASAYACEPGKGSEPGVGWNWVQQIAKLHEVWVITRANNRAKIEAATAKQPMPNVHWIYFDLPYWARFWKKGKRGIHLYYHLWQVGAYRAARKLNEQVGFDVVHHLTFVKYWSPSFMALLPVPFLWGPVGGADSTPLRFWFELSTRGKLYEFSRGVARTLSRLDPLLRMAWRKASMGLATTSKTLQRIQGMGCRNASVYSEAALPQSEIDALAQMPVRSDKPFRIVSIGTMLHLKGFQFGLRAFARLRTEFPDSEYWLIGAGVERPQLERLAQHLGLAGRVKFWGELPRLQVLEKLAECDVLLHPALHESGGWVALEAMAAGRPVVCLDLAGTAVQVTGDTGIKVPAGSPTQAVADLTKALSLLAGSPELRMRLGEAGRMRVAEHFNWETRGKFVRELYAKLAKTSDEPLPVSREKAEA